MSWLAGWIYRKEVTLTEQSSGDYTDYPTIITAAYDAHMKFTIIRSDKPYDRRTGPVL